MPADQEPNPYIVDALNLDFHYFFMRKLWFVQLACAVVFPGGYGTLDELAELLTLIQTGRSSGMPLGLLGNEYGDDILDKVRREVEKCDLFGGFLVMQSLAGGTGSGLGAKVSG